MTTPLPAASAGATGATTTADAVPAGPAAAAVPAAPAAKPVLKVIGALAFVHLLNDLIQAVLPAIYPLLKRDFGLSFAQVGLITLVYQMTASILQPWVGFYTDKHPQPYLLPCGTVSTLLGLALLSQVTTFPLLLVAAAMVGLGSATFHPEASRVVRMASGGRYGFAQSSFQVGGNSGSALGPLLAAAIIVPLGQGGVAWFTVFAMLAIAVLAGVSRWVVAHGALPRPKRALHGGEPLSRRRVAVALGVLAFLVFSKYVYMASISSYYTFYLIERFGVTVPQAQLHLFLFLAAVAVGTFVGGPVGDRIGRRRVIWASILGAAPFTLLLPHVGLVGCAVLSVVIGMIIASAFPAIVVYAQELLPGKVGMVSGLFFGLMFGVGGIAGAVLGWLADAAGISFVFQLCAFMPLLGILAVGLPDVGRPHR